jgi:hypothetical protein
MKTTDAGLGIEGNWYEHHPKRDARATDECFVGFDYRALD